MRKERKDKHFIKKPVFPGGPAAFKKFIKDNLKYPDDALENKIEGTVNLNMDIDYKGKVQDVKIVSGLGYGCDEEAIRICKLLRFEVPTHRGVRVLFHKKLGIHFKLPKKKKTTISYKYQTKKKVENKEADSNGYSYTITIS